MKFRLTLRRVFGIALIALIAMLSGLFYFINVGTRKGVLESAEKVRDVASERIGAEVRDFLHHASATVDSFQNELQFGALSPHFRGAGQVPSASDLDRVEAYFFAEMMERPQVSEVTLTWARAEGRTSKGRLRLQGPHGELSVFRMQSGDQSRLWTRRLAQDGNHFTAWIRRRAPGGSVFSVPLARLNTRVQDPTENLTFLTPTRDDFYGKPIWSDLHPSTLNTDDDVVTVQKTVEDAPGRFAGVLRVGLGADSLDTIAKIKVRKDDPNDAHIVFLCDNHGQLITRLPDATFRRWQNEDGSTRWISTNLPPAVNQALLAVPADLPQGQVRSTRFRMAANLLGKIGISGPSGTIFNDDAWLATYRSLAGSQDWLVGIVVPEEYYLGDVIAERNRGLMISLGLITVIVLGGMLTLRRVRESLEQIVKQAARMAGFDFSPRSESSRLSDVQSVLDSLEGAKTALRAMGKYVPVDLVSQLYHRNQEPVLGGEIMDVTLLFSDLANFTTLSEQLSPAALAKALGMYFSHMAAAIHDEKGTIDKYIGDSIMALWNAPEPCPDHAVMACRAVLACMREEKVLYASAAWKPLPPLVTRFGVHRDNVMVGHFGAEDRMSYTAMGDGVNVASRLEGLNKVYGTRAMVSETVYTEAHDQFVFRRLDRVAVKGKTRGIEVYELIGTLEEGASRVSVVRGYERALEAYLDRRFEEALEILTPQLEEDAPSKVLAGRCAKMLEAPPPLEWDGVFIARSK